MNVLASAVSVVIGIAVGYAFATVEALEERLSTRSHMAVRQTDERA
jgi:hypothetical protein